MINPLSAPLRLATEALRANEAINVLRYNTGVREGVATDSGGLEARRW